MKRNWIYKLFFVVVLPQMTLLTIVSGQSSSNNNDNYAASLPQVIPMTPQAAQFARYGEIPVGHTTGVPQIDIPIYTLSTGWIDIPISISYHASGFRVHDIPSPVGLGWVLNAGGLISRLVECISDFKSSTLFPNGVFNFTSAAQIDSLKSGMKKWQYASGNYYEDMSQWNSASNWESKFFDNRDGGGFDTRSDRYCYNFLGNSGVARYDVATNELKPVPYSPIKIKRIADNDYVITDTKGIKYEFSCPETTTNPNVQYYAATGWYLTKITYPGRESDSIVFAYKSGQSYYETIYTQTTGIIYAIDRGDGIAPVGTLESYFPRVGETTTAITPTGYSYYSPIVTSIKWRNVTINFNYASDRQDQRKERLTSVVVKDGNKVIEVVL